MENKQITIGNELEFNGTINITGLKFDGTSVVPVFEKESLLEYLKEAKRLPSINEYDEEIYIFLATTKIGDSGYIYYDTVKEKCISVYYFNNTSLTERYIGFKAHFKYA